MNDAVFFKYKRRITASKITPNYYNHGFNYWDSYKIREKYT